MYEIHGCRTCISYEKMECNGQYTSTVLPFIPNLSPNLNAFDILILQGVLQNRWAILYLLNSLAKDPKAKEQVCNVAVCPYSIDVFIHLIKFSYKFFTWTAILLDSVCGLIGRCGKVPYGCDSSGIMRKRIALLLGHNENDTEFKFAQRVSMYIFHLQAQPTTFRTLLIYKNDQKNKPIKNVRGAQIFANDL